MAHFGISIWDIQNSNPYSNYVLTKYGHFTSRSSCGVGEIRVEVQVSRKEFHAHALRLGKSRISILDNKKTKEKKN